MKNSLVFVAFLAAALGCCNAQTFNTIYTFPSDMTAGIYPAGTPYIDSSGIIYGTTQAGGQYGNGVVFSLTPPAQPGGAWTEAVLYNFQGGPDGCLS